MKIKILELFIFIVIATILNLLLSYKIVTLEQLVVGGLSLVTAKIMAEEIVSGK